MPRTLERYLPPAILAMGCLLLVLARRQEEPALRSPLVELLPSMDGYKTSDVTFTPDEERVAGMSSYVLRVFEKDSSSFSVYVGYYPSQLQGKSIHSPKNCLPGAGWEPVAMGTRSIDLASGPVSVNRYVLEREGARAVVYYWYQGRGRVAWNEYRVKWDLLRDKATMGRSEEALVRIVVGVLPGRDEEADSLATVVAGRLVDGVFDALPEYR